MHSQLEDYRSGFQSLKDEATALVADVDEPLLRRPPDEETWSVAQVLDHVNTAGWLLLTALENAIQRGRENGPYGEPPFRYGFVSRWFVRSMQPSSGWTFTAPSVFEPEAAETLYPSEAVEEFRALQDQFAECVVRAEGLDLRRIRVPSPAVPLLRISLGAWFEATLAHERRHLGQARDVLRALDAR
jgi:hypothetical protein